MVRGCKVLHHEDTTAQEVNAICVVFFVELILETIHTHDAITIRGIQLGYFPFQLKAEERERDSLKGSSNARTVSPILVLLNSS